MSADLCNDCGRSTAEDDMAPTCGAHILCVSCYTTGDFRCRECHRIWGELEAEGGVAWFDTMAAAAAAAIKADPFPAYVEPEAPKPLDMRRAPGVFGVETDHLSIRDCAHCGRGIHVGRPRVGHRLTASGRLIHYYHESCVVLP